MSENDHPQPETPQPPSEHAAKQLSGTHLTPPPITLDYNQRVNFAHQQIGIPVIRRIEIHNPTKHNWTNARLTISPATPWANELSRVLTSIPAGSSFIIEDLDLELQPTYLAELSERTRSQLTIQLSFSEAPSLRNGGTTPASEASIETKTEAESLLSSPIQQTFPVDIFAHDEWAGLAALPEILAAFITPNLRPIESLLSQTTQHLGQTTPSSALDGYQSKSKKRVFEILTAIYQTIVDQNIAYSYPPASFERTGQRIRFAPQILESKLATCLDLSLLFASLIEQSGLHPLIFIHQGHAYVGCWLVEESLPLPTSDDLQALRKRHQLEEIIVWETTNACQSPSNTFEQAIAAAQPHLALDDIFEFALDIHQARRSQIRPLPLQRGTGLIDATELGAPEKLQTTPADSETHLTSPGTDANQPAAPQRDFRSDDALTPPPQIIPANRIDHWKQQLLDLTLRNRFLNFRENKSTLPLLCADLSSLEDALAAQTAFQIRPHPQISRPSKTPPSDNPGSDRNSLTNEEINFLNQELSAKRLHTPLTDNELSRRLLTLYRSTRLEVEESGANTLFLALGMLEWKADPNDQRCYQAPILLIPVELTRLSAQQGFTLHHLDEDPLVNVTLLELLKRDFDLEIPGINPPPEDQSGVDVEQLLHRVNAAIRDLKGWELKKDAWLAQFSFSKFLLWKDLNDRADLLCNHPIVDHLVNHPGEPFTDTSDDLTPEQLDEQIPFDQIFCPLPSDSSQLTSIVAASQGKNFVMNGPPGTGKSQTIANVIAHCLATGKRVLFVAEKRAALEVVYHRLGQLGLAPFCLELHSNKAGKSEVIRQFGEALNYQDSRPNPEWQILADKLEILRRELNQYVRELHHTYPCGLNIYQSFTALIQQQLSPASLSIQVADLPTLDLPKIEQHPRDQREQLQQLCEQLIQRGQDRRLPANARRQLAMIKATNWTPAWEDEVFAAQAKTSAALDQFAPVWQTTASKLGIEASTNVSFNLNHTNLSSAVELANSLRGAPHLPALFILGDSSYPTWQAFRDLLDQAIEHGRTRDAARQQLRHFDLDQLAHADLPYLSKQFTRASEGGGLFVKVKHWLSLRPLRKCRKPGSPKFDPNETPTICEQFTIYQTAQNAIEQAAPALAARLGSHWNPAAPDWDQLAQLGQLGDQLHQHLQPLAGSSPEALTQLRQATAQCLDKANELLQTGAPLEQEFATLDTHWQRLDKASQPLLSQLQIDPQAFNLPFLEQLGQLCQSLTDHRPYLAAWCRYQEAHQQAYQLGLAPLLDLVDKQILPLEQLTTAQKLAYHQSLVKRVITLSPTLRDFFGDEHQRRIEAFNQLEKQYTELTSEIVAARLAARLPRGRNDDCNRNSELGILQREVAKKTRHKPVRKLLEETPHVTPLLKPCFLMSPLSVAQYLDPSSSNFDLVLFDEASQIPVWDAIGTIARGNQLIVVGDPKQLPPTNFFSRIDNDASDSTIPAEDFVDDLESILDECLGSGLRTYHLLWHYRSRKEGLIAFSNHHYYQNLLNTFPAPHANDVGVHYHHVPNGFYDKGKTRTNRAEALAIRDDVLRRLTCPQLAHHSIGIVTFSQAQQELILDLLDQARRDHPEIEAHFNNDLEEPLFVKNLENVQGDQRDVILFSIGYAADQNGRLSMNFGPLNRDGGERRLNVAVTRAKHEVTVFATLRSEQIDLSRTRAIGAAHLKAYLAYAERGPAAINTSLEAAHGQPTRSEFEAQIAAFLRENGHTVHTQVGCSAYRIDLAIVDPENPEHYLLGIECDGPTYQQAATAKDRERVRQAVLRSLGWQLYRAWSTDWWRNLKLAQQDLLNAVNLALDAHNQFKPATATDQATEPTTATAATTAAIDPSPHPPLRNYHSSSLPGTETNPLEPPVPRQQNYPPLQLIEQGDSEKFYEPQAKLLIQKQIQRIIQNEGPIHAELILRRVAQEWGFARVASRIRRIIEANLPKAQAKTDLDGTPIFWPQQLDPSSYHHYRNAPAELRKLEEVPPTEIKNALLDILEKHISFPAEALAKEIASHLGVSRVTQAAQDHITPTIQQLVENQTLILKDQTYLINQSTP